MRVFSKTFRFFQYLRGIVICSFLWVIRQLSTQIKGRFDRCRHIKLKGSGGEKKEEGRKRDWASINKQTNFITTMVMMILLGTLEKASSLQPSSMVRKEKNGKWLKMRTTPNILPKTLQTFSLVAPFYIFFFLFLLVHFLLVHLWKYFFSFPLFYLFSFFLFFLPLSSSFQWNKKIITKS